MQDERNRSCRRRRKAKLERKRSTKNEKKTEKRHRVYLSPHREYWQNDVEIRNKVQVLARD